jgi:hypothetical protein
MLVYQAKHQNHREDLLDIAVKLLYIHLKEKLFHLFLIFYTKL